MGLVTVLPIFWGKETFAQDGFRCPPKQKQAGSFFHIKALRSEKVVGSLQRWLQRRDGKAADEPADRSGLDKDSCVWVFVQNTFDHEPSLTCTSVGGRIPPPTVVNCSYSF